jgi:protein transport protein SEC23
MVGLITFGTMVQVHELGFQDCPKSFVFRGTKDVSAEQVHSLLGVGRKGQGARGPGGAAPPGGESKQGGGPGGPGGAPGGAAGGAGSGISRFLLPVSECGFALESILEDLTKDPWPVKQGERPQRCTGVALSIAVGLLETTYAHQGARVMLFVGGPPTVGPGTIVGRQLAEPMRSHTDLAKGNAPLFKKAQEHFAGLAERCVASSHVIDIFACSLDQIGLLEMKVCVERTGGLVVLADFFGQSGFKESFKRVFSRFPAEPKTSNSGHLKMGFAATLEVTTSQEFKVQGAIGPCSSLKRSSKCVSESPVGEGGTYAWSMGGVDPSTTVGLYFEVVNSHNNPLPAGKRWHIQLVTQYQHADGHRRMRVTTLGGPWQPDPSDLLPIAQGFDQEAAAVLMARLAVYRSQTQELTDILRWLDRSLIRLTAKFADYRKDDPSSLRLSTQFSIYPQFMFHLRRSSFLQVFNSSPDESAYYRAMLIKENTTNSLTMIQPSLLSYTFSAPPVPVLLDNVSVKPDCILLLDTFFHVLIFHGETIASWRDQVSSGGGSKERGGGGHNDSASRCFCALVLHTNHSPHATRTRHMLLATRYSPHVHIQFLESS